MNCNASVGTVDPRSWFETHDWFPKLASASLSDLTFDSAVEGFESRVTLRAGRAWPARLAFIPAVERRP